MSFGVFISLFVIWLILNGKITVQIVVVGLLMACAVAWFYAQFIITGGQGRKRFRLKRMVLYAEYFLLLVWEIIKANLAVLKIAVAREFTFEPALIYFDVDLKETSSLVLLANSITLTPGTITVTQEGNQYCVHCLDRSMGDGIDSSSFVTMLQKIEEA